MINYNNFYKELGKLLYAIAKIDGKIQKKEFERFREIVKEEVVPIENKTDSYGSDLAFYAEFEFEGLEDLSVKPEEAFDSFMEYLKQNKSYMTEDIKHLIVGSVEKVASAYRGINKEEESLVERVKKEIQIL